MELLIPALIALALAAGLFLVFFGLDTAIGPDVGIEERLGKFTTIEPTDGKKRKGKGRGGKVGAEEESTGNVVAQRVNQAIAKRDFAQNLAIELARADLKLTPGEFLIINAVVTLV